MLHAAGCAVSGDDASGFAAAVEAARRAEVAVVCVGGKSGLMPDCTSGEFRDAADLGLTGVQQQLVEAVVATGTPTVVVLINGRVFALPWIARHVPAVVEAWLPGEEGGAAIADVLFGAVNPSGRLPVSLPRTVGQVPIYYGHKSGGGRSQMLGDYSDAPAAPLFPFGHGLSYTRFAYADLDIVAAARRGRPVDHHRGARCATPAAAPATRWCSSTCATSSPASPGRCSSWSASPACRWRRARRAALSLHPRPQPARFLRPAMRFVVEPGDFEVMVGASSADIRAEGRFVIEGPPRELRTTDLAPTRVAIT